MDLIEYFLAHERKRVIAAGESAPTQRERRPNPSTCGHACERKSRSACRECMELFYGVMHDDAGRPIELVTVPHGASKSANPLMGVAHATVEWSMTGCPRDANGEPTCLYDNGMRCILNAQGKTLKCSRINGGDGL